ncbi:MAG: amino acid carrier protein [Selenomonadaceae bacterium]|nr:amino acid carrier protein [Selenomonadaceae bacterium]
MNEWIGNVCSVFQQLADLIWDFPTNFDWYRGIPIIGELPFIIIFLVGTGIYFSLKLGFVQIKYFLRGIKNLMTGKSSKRGISPLASFLLSTAMRVGPGNILGVTGAVSTGGPGALFWMWLSAFFGMATAFVESTLSQIYKDRQGDDYVGGLPCYGRKLLGGATFVGVALSLLYIVYAILCLPAQGFNTLSAMVAVVQHASGSVPSTTISWVFFALLTGLVIFTIFGGLKRVIKITNVLVPIMAVIYVGIVLVIILMNLDRLPWFFYAVVTEAFQPESIFGGTLGIALSQGIKRGLMSNEAGQGTLSIPAAVADAKHPCEQGLIQSIGVFLDTMIICTMTGFIVVMSQLWLTDAATDWFEMGRLQKFLASCGALTDGGISYEVVAIVLSLCFGTFAFTSLLGFLSFSEISVKEISQSKIFLMAIRFLNLLVLTFGMATNIAGFDLSALWNLSDLANVIMVCFNLPLLYLGFGKVQKTYKHFTDGKGNFNSETLGEQLPVWDEKYKQHG